MAKIRETGGNSAELVDETGRLFAEIEFVSGTNPASRKDELLDGAEHWANGGEGTPEFRLASRLRALLNVKLSSQEDMKTRQQLCERKLLDALGFYIGFFRDPANAQRKRDSSLPGGTRKPMPQYRPQRRR